MKPIDDQRMRVRAQALLERVRDPNVWGESEFVGRGAIGVWDWAEATRQVALQAEIAYFVLEQRYFAGSRKRVPEFVKRVELLASQAKMAGRWKDYAGFLEALWLGERDGFRRQVLVQEICEVYARLGEREKESWYISVLASGYMREGRFGEVKQLLLDSYQLSLDAGWQKGVGMVLMRMADFLECQGCYVDACRFFYRAKLLFNEIGSIFGITARDLLVEVLYRHPGFVVSKEQYDSPGSPDELVGEFRKLGDQ